MAMSSHTKTVVVRSSVIGGVALAILAIALFLWPGWLTHSSISNGAATQAISCPSPDKLTVAADKHLAFCQTATGGTALACPTGTIVVDGGVAYCGPLVKPSTKPPAKPTGHTGGGSSSGHNGGSGTSATHHATQKPPPAAPKPAITHLAINLNSACNWAFGAGTHADTTGGVYGIVCRNSSGTSLGGFDGPHTLNTYCLKLSRARGVNLLQANPTGNGAGWGCDRVS